MKGKLCNASKAYSERDTHKQKRQSLDNSKMVLGDAIGLGALMKQLGSGLQVLVVRTHSNSSE